MSRSYVVAPSTATREEVRSRVPASSLKSARRYAKRDVESVWYVSAQRTGLMPPLKSAVEEKGKRVMKKFRVRVVETVNYLVDVEAEDEEAARERAVAVIIESKDRDKFCESVTERDTDHVFENPPLWSKSEPGNASDS
jgi:hypothetical protein